MSSFWGRFNTILKTSFDRAPIWYRNGALTSNRSHANVFRAHGYLIAEMLLFRVTLHLEGRFEVLEALLARRQICQIHALLLVRVNVTDHVIHRLKGQWL